MINIYYESYCVNCREFDPYVDRVVYGAQCCTDVFCKNKNNCEKLYKDNSSKEVLNDEK